MTKMTISNNSEPDTPSTGRTVLWSDLVTKTLKSKDDTGAVLAYGDTKKALVSPNDTTEGYLEDKLVPGSGITLNVQNEGGNENILVTNALLTDLNPSGLVVSTSGIITINGGDPSLFDITETKYFIKGLSYTLAADTGIDPNFSGGSNTSFVGVNSAGLVYSSILWTSEQLKTILPLARLGAASGETGPGSTITIIRDDRFFIDEQNYNLRNWMEHAFGALYHTDGVITKSATALQLDQSAGRLFDAQGKEQFLSSINNISALKIFHTGGIPTALPVDPLIVDTAQYDDGANLSPIPSNKWVCHTLLKSPKGAPQEGGFFFVYANTTYSNQTEASLAPVDFSIFTDQHTSGLVPVARIIVQQGGSVITSVFDERPFAVGGTGGATTSSNQNLQQVYESSSIPQIILNATQGLLDIRDSSAPLGTDLFAVKDNAGTTTFFKINANGITVIGNIVVSGTVDGRDVSADGDAIDLNTAKVTNANHTGEVTGSGALALNKTAISNKTFVTADPADYVLIEDISDSSNIKKALVSDLGSGNTVEVAYVKDVKGAADFGGGFTAGSWITRDLNDLTGVTSFITLTANQIILTDGTYEIHGSAPGANVTGHTTRFENITDTVTELIGSAEYAVAGSNMQTRSEVMGTITVVGTKTYEFQHRCQVTAGTFGLGLSANFGVNNIYAQMSITKIS